MASIFPDEPQTTRRIWGTQVYLVVWQEGGCPRFAKLTWVFLPGARIYPRCVRGDVGGSRSLATLHIFSPLHCISFPQMSRKHLK